jgi:hypothetical protein
VLREDFDKGFAVLFLLEGPVAIVIEIVLNTPVAKEASHIYFCLYKQVKLSVCAMSEAKG